MRVFVRKVKSKKLTGKEKLELAKAKAKQVIGNGREITPNEQRAQKMAYAYEDALRKYACLPTLKFLRKPITSDHPATYHVWLRAAMIAEGLEMGYDEYIKAQFFYFDKWFNKAPKPLDIASYKTERSALKRAMMYRLEESAPKGNIVGPVRPTPAVPQSVKWTNSDRVLKSMSSNFKVSEEEILRVFAQKESADLFFDSSWLSQHPIYLKLKAAGEIS